MEEPISIISYNVDFIAGNHIIRYETISQTILEYEPTIIFLHEVLEDAEKGFDQLLKKYNKVCFAIDSDGIYGSILLVRKDHIGFDYLSIKFKKTLQGRWILGVKFNSLMIISCHAESNDNNIPPVIYRRANQFNQIRHLIKGEDYTTRNVFIGDLNTEDDVVWFSKPSHGSKELFAYGNYKTWISSRNPRCRPNVDKRYDRAFISKNMNATLSIIPTKKIDDSYFASDHDGLYLLIE